MTNETDGTSITIDPIDSFVGKENQSGHFARFEGSINSNGEYKPTPQDKLKLSFTMTDEEAMLELQHGKYGSPEYYEAQQKLVAKVVGTYKKGEQNFLQDNDQLGVMTMFKHNLSEKWKVAQGLLKIDPTSSLQENPSKYRLIHTLSDTSVVYQDAYNLTKAYVDNTLTDREDKVRFNNLTPELRREMLKLFDLPAGAKEPNDGVSGVQEKWMYEGIKPVTPPESPNRPAPDSGGSSDGGSPEGDGGGGSGGNEQQEDVDNPELAKLVSEIKKYVNSEFSQEARGRVHSIMNDIGVPEFQRLTEVRADERAILFATYHLVEGNPRFLITNSISVDHADTINFNDSNNNAWINERISILTEIAERSGLTFEELMLMNMTAYYKESEDILRADFNFKRQLLERYREQQSKKTSQTKGAPNNTQNRKDQSKPENAPSTIDAEAQWKFNNRIVTLITITDEIREDLKTMNTLEDERDNGNFPLFITLPSGDYQQIARFDLETARFMVDSIDLDIDDFISQRTYQNEAIPEKLVNLTLADVVKGLEKFEVKGESLLERAERVRGVLLTRLNIPQLAVAGSTDYSGFEDKLRLAMWAKYKSDNGIIG